MTPDTARHWETVYDTKAPDEVSWYQREPRVSMELITGAAPSLDARIIDVGGGASTLVDALLAAGYSHITVLDIATAALAQSRTRLGALASRVTWLDADVLQSRFAPASFDVWHDRAVFHFLTQPEDRARYVSQVRSAVRPGGHVIVATFAEDGPTRCSGLDVVRYSPAQLQDVFGAGFVMETSVRESHVTPSGGRQAFTYCVFRCSPRDFERATS